jgi:hypothetical protein
MVERLAVNEDVVGSSPTAGAFLCKKLDANFHRKMDGTS